MDAANIQQWDTLTAQAAALVDNLTAAWCEARERRDWTEAGRIITIRRQAMKRWERRVDAWAVAAYGEGVK